MMLRRPTLLNPILVALALGLLTPFTKATAQSEEWDARIVVEDSQGDAEEFLRASSSDPERWPAGYSYVRSSDLELGTDTSHAPQVVGLRFTDLPVPPGSRITEAVVRLVPDTNAEGPLNLSIRVEDSPSAAPFVEDPDGSASRNLTSRTLAPASQEWSPPPFTAEEAVLTPDLSALLQPIVDSGGWRSGGSIVLLFSPSPGSGDGTRSVYSYDSSPERSPELLLRFSPPVGAPVSPPEPEVEPEPAPADPAIATGQSPSEPPTPADPSTANQESLPEPPAPTEPVPAEPPPAQPDVPGPPAPAESPAADPAQPAPTESPAADPAQPAGPVDTPAPASSEPRRVRVPLQATHAAGVNGSVLLSDYGLERTIVSVRLDNAAPQARYRVALHGGECDAIHGIIAMLEEVDGNLGMSTSILNVPLDDLLADVHHLNVYRIGELTRLAGCAQIGP